MDKEIIYVDYSGCKEVEMVYLTQQHRDLVLKENRPSLFMANYENTYGTPDYMKAAKDFTQATSHLITKGAFLGITGAKVYLLKGITFFFNVNFKTFATKEEALEFLVSE
jgi:hypothetical protein